MARASRKAYKPSKVEPAATLPVSSIKTGRALFKSFLLDFGDQSELRFQAQVIATHEDGKIVWQGFGEDEAHARLLAIATCQRVAVNYIKYWERHEGLPEF